MARISFLVFAGILLTVLVATAGCGSGGDAPGADSEGTAPGPATEGVGQTPSGPSLDPAMPKPPPRPTNPVVVIETSLGNITLELDRENARETVDNFLGYVDRGFYDGTIIHQVFPGAVILGGMFTPDLTEKKPGAPIRNQADNGLKNVRGTIGMARDPAIIDSATSGFFINVKDNPNYDHVPDPQGNYDRPEDYGYCVFGKVVQGMEVAERISNVETQDRPDFEKIPAETVLIKTVRRMP